MTPPLPAEIAEAARATAAGQVVCFPTETSYGLAVDVRSAAGLARLVALKGRDPSSPFGLIAADADLARALAAVWPATATELAERHWPGPLTLVVPAREDLPPEVVGPTGGVGVRVSSHPWALALAGAVGAAITATSANPSGGAPATTIGQAREYFAEEVAVYLDDGPSPDVAASTVVDIGAGGAVTVLRRGPVLI